MSNNNTHLPADVHLEIDTKANEYVAMPGVEFSRASADGYIAGATEYAQWKVKYDNLKREADKLRQWKREACLIIDPIIEYGQGRAPLGSSCTEFVLNRCRKYDELKVHYEKVCRTLSRMTLSMQVHPHCQPKSEFLDLVTEANESLAIWEGKGKLSALPQPAEKDNGEYMLVFTPCAEDDPWACGSYTSNDGQSLCFVREGYVPKEGNSLLPILKNITLADIDAPVFTHTQQFREHFDFIKSRFLEVVANGDGKEGEKEVKPL